MSVKPLTVSLINLAVVIVLTIVTFVALAMNHLGLVIGCAVGLLISPGISNLIRRRAHRHNVPGSTSG